MDFCSPKLLMVSNQSLAEHWAEGWSWKFEEGAAGQTGASGWSCVSNESHLLIESLIGIFSRLPFFCLTNCSFIHSWCHPVKGLRQKHRFVQILSSAVRFSWVYQHLTASHQASSITSLSKHRLSREECMDSHSYICEEGGSGLKRGSYFEGFLCVGGSIKGSVVCRVADWRNI